MNRIFTTTLRLNLDDTEDHQAWEYLHRLDRRQYRSYSKAIVSAVNDYFERQNRLVDDPYLETREKEDMFLQKVLEAIEVGSKIVAVSILSTQSNSPVSDTIAVKLEGEDEDLSVALDFADSF